MSKYTVFTDGKLCKNIHNIQNIHCSGIFCIFTNTKVTLHCCMFMHNIHWEYTGVYFVYSAIPRLSRENSE